MWSHLLFVPIASWLARKGIRYKTGGFLKYKTGGYILYKAP